MTSTLKKKACNLQHISDLIFAHCLKAKASLKKWLHREVPLELVEEEGTCFCLGHKSMHFIAWLSVASCFYDDDETSLNIMAELSSELQYIGINALSYKRNLMTYFSKLKSFWSLGISRSFGII